MTNVLKIALTLLVTAACGVQEQQVPEPIPKDQLPVLQEMGRSEAEDEGLDVL